MRKTLGFLALLFFLLAGCSGGSKGAPVPDGNAFLPPTISAPTSPAATPSAPLKTPEAALPPAATPECTNNLTFLEDLSIPDGTEFAPSSPLDKRWLVQNNGTCNWDVNYRLKLIAGQEMGAVKDQALYPARSGARASIRLLFESPEEPGTYRSAWQAFDPQGNAFGDPIFIEIVVK